MYNVFIPHRWNYSEDYDKIVALLDRSKFSIRDYSIPQEYAFSSIDRRYNVDPQIQAQIKHASFLVCSNRPANNNGIALNEIEFAMSIGKPVVAVKITDNTSWQLQYLGVPVIPYNKSSLELWVKQNV